MSYIVKRSDGAVWAKCQDHPAYGWFKDQAPAIYETEREAKQTRLRLKGFMTTASQTVTVEEYNG